MGVHGCIAVAINLTIVFAEIVKFASNNYFHTFVPPPLDEILATPLNALDPNGRRILHY